MRCFYTTPPPSIPPEQLASGSRRVSRQRLASGSQPVSRQSCLPVDPAEYPARGSPVDPSQYPARAACQWIPLSIPEQLASGSRRVSRQSGSPVDPAEYPAGPAPAQHPARAARQWIPPSIPPERLASGSRRVSHQSSPPMGVVREWIPSSITPASGSRRVSHHSSPPVESGKYPAEYPRAARQRIPPSIPLSIPCRWILPSIRPISSQSGSPVFASGSRQYPARAARQFGFAVGARACALQSAGLAVASADA